MIINGFNVLLDDRVAHQLVYFWTYAAINGRHASNRAPQDRLTVRLVDKRTHGSTTLTSLVRRIMGDSTQAARLLSEEETWDFRAQTPEQWLAALPTGISPQLDPPALPLPADACAVRVSGKHPVNAIVVDAAVLPLPGPLYAYDTASGFNVKLNNRGLARFLFGPGARRMTRSSLYDFRRTAFLYGV